MKVLITGATGAIGNKVGQKLIELGHQVVCVSRSKEKALVQLTFPAEIIEVDLSKEALVPQHFVGIDAVIHMMGETIDGRWTSLKKQNIRESREVSSQNLLVNLPSSVQVVISSSGQAYYGSRGDEIVNETSTKGSGFLADVCEEWEKPFRQLKQRNVQLRTTMVLDHQSGALKKLLSIFQKNLGATLGSGQQWMSWIAMQDMVDVVVECLTNKEIQGPIDCASPKPIQNKDFTKLLCETLRVLQGPSVPEFVLKLLLGEMASLVLDSIRVEPLKLKKIKFNFKYTDISQYFEEELKFFKDGHQVFTSQQYVPASIQQIFDFFSEAGNLEKITPPILHFHIAKVSTDKVAQGTLIDYNLKIHGLPVKWRTLIEAWDPPRKFIDTQLKGPYSYWHHTHSFVPFAEGTLMTDFIRYKVPLGYIGYLIAGSFVQKDVENIFKYRREVIARMQFSTVK